MQLVLLAAGHGRRFGGLKQLAPVGPRGEAIMDYTARDAVAGGFGGVILIVREEIQEELLDHVESFWPAELNVESVIQGAIAGTAQAVGSARPFIDGPFGVANADDLYGTPAVVALAEHLKVPSAEQVLVAYRLRDTVLTDATVTRGICEAGADSLLGRIVEHSVRRLPDGTFEGSPLVGRGADEPRPLSGEEDVSMNLWGFAETMLDELDDALDAFEPETAPHLEGKPPELLLPDVVGRVVAAGRAPIRVVPSNSRCIGLTHPDDVPLVRSLIAEGLAG